MFPAVQSVILLYFYIGSFSHAWWANVYVYNDVQESVTTGVFKKTGLKWTDYPLINSGQ